MDDINDILNDESNNDKQLIKELSIYIKHHRDKKLPFNKQFILNILKIVLSNSEIDFGEINFISTSEDVADWDINTSELRFSINSMMEEAKYLKVTAESKIGDNRLLYYYYFIETIVHELTHARQSYIMKTKDNYIYDSGKILVNQFIDVYDENHDEVLLERYANLRGAIIAYSVLSYIYPLNKIKDLRCLFFSHLLDGYDIIHDGNESITKNSEVKSAIDTYNGILDFCDLPKVDIELDEDTPLYERLYLGDKISLEEYSKLMILFYNLEHSNEEVKNVQKLINKL